MSETLRKNYSQRFLSPYRSINYLLQKSEAFQSVHHVTFILCYNVLSVFSWFPLPLRSVQSGHPPDVLHLCISDIRVRKGYREEEKSLKKWTSFILILIIALNLAGCSNRNVNRNLQNKPDITGTVLEVQDNSILLEINKEGYPDGTRCKVSLNEKNRDNYAEVSVGDEVVVYYDGKIAESDPLQINTVYGITLKNSVD